MSRRRANIKELEYNVKFDTMEQAIKEAENIVRVAKNEANKIDDCIYKIYIGVSNVEGCLGEFNQVKKKTKGRPKKRFKTYDCIVKNKNPNTRKIKVDKPIHLHIVSIAIPSSQFAINICKHINKRKHNTIVKAFSCNSNYIDYVKGQSSYYRKGSNDINNIL